MRPQRIKYILLTALIIGLGLLSRRLSGLPLWLGDLLYASMMTFLLQSLFIKMNKSYVAILALAVTFLVEFSQLYQGEWIVQIRQTLLGRLVLGQGFLVSDLLAYTTGVILAYLVISHIKKGYK